jgi:Tol biopolymer transport system component
MRPTLRWSTLCPLFAAAIVLAACSPEEPLAPRTADPPRRGPAPALAISDAVFNHGNPRFFWLPPMVKNPSYSGQPDGTLKPHVLVCVWRADVDRCGDVVADFNTTGGTGSQTVRYDATAGLYIVNWDTKTCLRGACTLSTTQPYRIRVFVGGSQLGFADVDLADNGKEIKNLDTSGDYVPLVNGRTLPVKFRIEKGAVAVVAPGAAAPVGTAGGTVTVAGEAATLDIPSGALATSTGISVAQPASQPPGLITGLAPVVELGPDGTQFAKPVLLTLPLNPTKLPPGIPLSALGIYTAVGTGWQEVGGSVVDEARGTVTAPISHFSIYSVQVRPNTATGTPTPTVIQEGDSTVVSSQAFAYDVVPQQVCTPVYGAVPNGSSWSWVIVDVSCTTYTQRYYYYPQGVAVSWSSGNTQVAGVATGPTFTNASGVAESPPIKGLAAGSTAIFANAGGVVAAIGITVTPANRPRIVVMSLKGSQPGARRLHIWIMDPDGGNARALAPTLEDQDEYPDISRDTRTVVFASTRPGSFQIFRINPDGTGLTQVTNLGSVSNGPRMSPDGKRVLFYSDAEGRTNIYTVPVTATMAGLAGATRITDDPADELLPDWSPDGRRIVFASNRTGILQLYTRDLGTGYERQLTFDAGNHTQPRWAPQGSVIVYHNEATGTLWTVNADDGRPPVQLTTDAVDHAPAWSADGRQVIFASNRAGGSYFQVYSVTYPGRVVSHFLTTDDETLPSGWRDPSIAPVEPPSGVVAVLSTRGSRPLSPKNDVFLMNPDGTNLRALASTLDAQEEFPDLSRDRKTVVFGSTRAGGFQIFRVGADNTGLTQVTNMGSFTRGPRLSPDGRRIAFLSDAAGQYRIYAVSVDATMATLGDVEALTTGPGDDVWPDWSPDGTRIVFSSNRNGGGHQLFVRDLATGQDRQLTFDAGVKEYARWSPTGSTIVYVNTSSNTIWSVDADDGAAPRQLTQGANDGVVGWSPDGGQLLFGTNRAGLAWFQLYRMNADGTGLRLASDTQEDLGAPTWR